MNKPINYRKDTTMKTKTILAAALAALLLTACATKNDTISQAEKADKAKPSIAETKAIAE
jgi:uncharacterized lipoprotein YajG